MTTRHELATTRTGLPHSLGNLDLLGRPILALIGSVHTPPDLVLPALDLITELSATGTVIAGGFQTPLERAALERLLALHAPVVICLSTSLRNRKLPLRWQRFADEGHLLALAATDARRATRASGATRNKRLVEIADAVFVVHAAPGGGAYRTASYALGMGRAVYCMAHPRNTDLEILGARAIRTAAGIEELQLDRRAAPGEFTRSSTGR